MHSDLTQILIARLQFFVAFRFVMQRDAHHRDMEGKSAARGILLIKNSLFLFLLNTHKQLLSVFTASECISAATAATAKTNKATYF